MVHTGLVLLIAGFTRSGSDRLDGMLEAAPGKEASLIALPIAGSDASERLEWKRRLECLLDSLQEAVDLWHPVNRDLSQSAAFAKKVA